MHDFHEQYTRLIMMINYTQNMQLKTGGPQDDIRDDEDDEKKIKQSQVQYFIDTQ